MGNSLIHRESIIRERIESAFIEESEKPERVASDIGFHMTDWIDDLQLIQEFYSNIERASNEEIVSFIYRFLIHVPNHLNAAMKLSGIGKVEDIFMPIFLKTKKNN